MTAAPVTMTWDQWHVARPAVVILTTWPRWYLTETSDGGLACGLFIGGKPLLIPEWPQVTNDEITRRLLAAEFPSTRFELPPPMTDVPVELVAVFGPDEAQAMARGSPS